MFLRCPRKHRPGDGSMRRRYVERGVRQAAITRADGAGAPRAIDEEACEAFEQGVTRSAPIHARDEAASPWSRQETIAMCARGRLPRSTVTPPDDGEDANDLTGVDEARAPPGVAARMTVRSGSPRLRRTRVRLVSRGCAAAAFALSRTRARHGGVDIRTCEFALDRRCGRRDGVPSPALQPGGVLGEVA